METHVHDAALHRATYEHGESLAAHPAHRFALHDFCVPKLAAGHAVVVLSLARESREYVRHVFLGEAVELFPGKDVPALEHALQGLGFFDHGAALEAVEHTVKAIFNNQEIAFNDLRAGVTHDGEVHLDTETACHGFGILLVFHDLVATALAGEVAVAVFATVVHVDFFREPVTLNAVTHGAERVLGARGIVVQAPAHGHVGLEVHEERDVAGGGLFLPLHLHEHVPRAGIAHPHLPRLQVGVVAVQVETLVVVELLLAFAGKVNDVGRELALEPAIESRLARELALVLHVAAFHGLAERNHPAGEYAYLVRGQVGVLEILEPGVAHGGVHHLAVVDERDLPALADLRTLTVDALDARLHFGVCAVPVVHETAKFLGARDAFALEQDERPLVEVLLRAVGGTVVAPDDRFHVLGLDLDFRAFGECRHDVAVGGFLGETPHVNLEHLPAAFVVPAVFPHGGVAAHLPLGNPQELGSLR